jgi:hypothetical protein
MVAGDHIQIRNRTGSQIYNEQNGYEMVTLRGAGCQGVQGNPKVWENYPGENVILDGTLDIKGSTWTSIGGGVWSCSGGTCHALGSNRFYVWIAWWSKGATVDQEIYIQTTSQTCDSTVPVGYLRWTGSAVCVHTPDGLSPATSTSFKIPYIAQAFGVNYADSPSHVKWQKNPSGGSFTIRRFQAEGIVTIQAHTDYIIDGLDIGYMMDRCIDFDSVNGGPLGGGYQVLNSHIHHCGQEGMHTPDDTGGLYRVDNNLFEYIQAPPVFPVCSAAYCATWGMTDGGCAMRVLIPSATGGYIGNNEFRFVGGGRAGAHTTSVINVEGGATNLIIENNYIHDSSPKLGTGNAGVAGILISSGPPANCTNCTFRNNRFYNVDQGIAWEGNGDSTTLKIYNNTFVNVYEFAIGQSYGSIPGTIATTNNIFYNSTPPVSAFISTGGESGFTSFTYNDFFCNGCAGNTVLARTSTTYTAATVGNLGTGNLAGDPNISLTGSPPTLNILSASGAAFQRGTALTPTFPDYRGNARPTSGNWDIGAYEFPSTVSTLPPPLNFRVQ